MPNASSSSPFTITVSEQLSDEQRRRTETLAAACRQADSISLTYPSGEEDCRHYLLSGPDGQLLAALAVLPYDDLQAECCAFTHPRCRRQGYFSLLLERALADWEEHEFIFAAEEACGDTRAVLESLGAELNHRELQMEYRAPVPDGASAPCQAAQGGLSGGSPALQAAPSTSSGGSPMLQAAPSTSSGGSPALQAAPGTPSGGTLLLRQIPAGLLGDDGQLWQLTGQACPDRVLGTCRTSPLSPGSVCLHHVEIREAFRQKGLGTSLVRMLLAKLAADGVTHVLLHVSGDNLPAVALYKKTGFRVTKTLSCYLY